jgi:hypothetical protein
MPTYRYHFAADDQAPLPLPLDGLGTVDAPDPISAVESLLSAGRVPQDGSVKLVQVVAGVDAQGKPREVVRVPIPLPFGGELLPQMKEMTEGILNLRRRSRSDSGANQSPGPAADS